MTQTETGANMAIAVSEKEVNGSTYVYIIDSFRDPISKNPTSTILKRFGNKKKLLAKNPNAMEEVERICKELQQSTEAYEKATQENLGTSPALDEAAFSSKNLSTSYQISVAPYLKLWEELGLRVLFRDIGRNHGYTWDVPTTMFYNIVSRILSPSSRLNAWQNRNRHLFDFENIRLEDMYECLDILACRRKKLIRFLNEAIGRLYERDLTVALYDVTTFYFESFTEDNLRSRGMSKEHRTQETQVVLGLLADADGIPLGYELFPGNTSEVRTLLKIVQEFRAQYKLEKVTVIADAGLNQLINIAALEKAGFDYIVGYPPYVKLTLEEQEKLLADDDDWKTFASDDDLWRFKSINLEINKTVRPTGRITKKRIELKARCIATYSEQRYNHDIRELNQKWEKANELVSRGKAAVSAASRSGYKSFIRSTLNAVTTNVELYQKRKKWCGYTALLTNLKEETPQEVYGLLRQLWRIEENFRVMKTNLRARPVFVWTEDHIRGHFLLNYIGLVMHRLMQKQLREKGLEYSVKLTTEALSAVKVCPMHSLKKAKSELYCCSIEKAERLLPDGTTETLETVAKKVLEACGFAPLHELETHSSLMKIFGRSIKLK